MKKSQKSQRLAFPKLDRRGIPLAEVIAVHRQFSPPQAIAENLGDGFLYARNPVFRNVRDEALKRGFSFAQEGCAAYHAFPLMALDEVITSGRIPYRPNFPWLEKLEKRVPRALTLTELKGSELQFNYLFHEAAHCVAHSILFGKATPASLAPQADTLLGILMGEAMANVAECVASAFPEGEIGGYFLHANCHFRASQRDARAIASLVKKHGFPATIRVLLSTFLYANFLYKKIGPREQKLIARFAGLPRAEDVGPVARIGLMLDDEFRTTTTRLHLMKLGFPADPGRLMRYDPVARLLSAPYRPLREKFEAMAEVIGRGVALD